MENITNADSVLYNMPCKFFLSDDGNKCRYGRKCHYLHYTHLHREPVQTRDLHSEVCRLQTEVARQGKIVDLLTDKLQVHLPLLQQAATTEEEACEYKLEHVPPPLTSPPLPCALLAASKASSQNRKTEKMHKAHDTYHQDDNSSATKSTLSPLAETYTQPEPAPAPKPKETGSDIGTIDETAPSTTTRIPNLSFLEFPDQILNVNINIEAENQEFMKFIWANSSSHLSALLPTADTYPKVLLGTSKDGVVFENAQLCNLKAAQHNGKLIRVCEYVESRSRYKIEIIDDPDADPQHMLVRRQNIQVLEMRDISLAFQDFVDHLDAKPDLLELLRKDPGGNRIIGEFVNFHVPPIDIPELISEEHAWNDIISCMICACTSSELTVSKRDCPQIVSLLYALCFEKESTYYLWKRYLIPNTWSMKQWSTCYGISAPTQPDLTS